ncbi:MAG: tyrosine--tRNA ligase [Acidimicrobiales bacterium]|nr:tyrosine--tRNA ligase [Acidimicrobiales bacterium]MDP6285491.1 tyrosine--tRNA ligase [Acidimicrobiales bacterium]HJO40616.1 tyrosine--tRNA ligase [Acidimicrobiales bacterium]
MGNTERKGILEDLTLRGLLQDSTDQTALQERLEQGPITLYCGFDPTADSLHLGHLVPLLTLRRFQDAGHRPIALAGGATGMVGDPSGRSEERNLLDQNELSSNVAAVAAQLESFLSFDAESKKKGIAALLVDNREWTVEVNVLDFLRDVGKHVTVGTMLSKESVKTRLASEQGLSFTEFSYMLLQANDFFELHKNYECEMQIGGSDQWGNITAGIDMIRRRSSAIAYGLTVPLVTRSDGAKFGKTAEGTVWLDSKRTLPYELHQYLINVDDRDVEKLLLQLTLVSVSEISELMLDHRKSPEDRSAQQRLATEVCRLVHGDEEAEQALLATQGLFGSKSNSEDSLEALRGIVPETEVRASDLKQGEESLIDVLVLSGLCSSRGDARRTIAAGGISVNGDRQATDAVSLPNDLLLNGDYVLIQKGKKNRHLLVIV